MVLPRVMVGLSFAVAAVRACGASVILPLTVVGATVVVFDDNAEGV